MDVIRLVELAPGEYSLLLNAGSTAVDDVIDELGHEPNGYFWDGIAELLVRTEAPALDGRFSYDSEGGMFVASGTDRDALEDLRGRLAGVASDPDRIRDLVAYARANDFEFDD